MSEVRNPKVAATTPVLVLLCLVCSPAWAADLGDGTRSTMQVSRYVFQGGQSTVVQTGGFAGVHWTYSVSGQFVLTVDRSAGTASFSQVDANGIDDSPFKRTLDPNQVFNMASLAGRVVDETTLSFTGKADDGSEVRIMVTLQNGSSHLVGLTTPPAGSADFFVFTVDAIAQRKYSGGTGEPTAPYKIATAADLILLGETAADYDKHFILAADLDLAPNLAGRKVFDKAVIAPDVNDTNEAWRFDGTPFTGVFDGNEHTISHLTIRGKGYLGLFGVLGPEAEVKDLGVIDVNVLGTRDCTGALAGSNGSDGRFAGGSLTRCYSTGVVSGNDCAGHLAGRNLGDIGACHADGTVSGGTRVGGLIGSNTLVLLTGVYEAGKVSRCYSTAIVAGTEMVGGLVGDNACVDVGQQDPVLVCAEVTDSFWDNQASGRTTSAGGTGKTTAQMQTASTYLAAGWDFVDETANGTDDLWRINEGKDYPRLRWEQDKSRRLPVIELDATNFDAQIAGGVILVDFYATWCPHCTRQAPALEEVADRLQGRAKVGKLDIDKAPAVSQRYGVTAIPTLIVFQKGLPVKRFVGETSADVLVLAILAALDSPAQASQ